MNKKQHGGGHKKHITETYKVKGYETRVFTSAEEFLKHAEGDDGIKLVKNEFPSCKGLLVMDGSLSAKGPVEDRIYSDFPFYRNNLRRGLTLGKFGVAVYWLRKGLRKFFDVNLPALKGEAKGDNQHFATFREIENVLSMNSSYENPDEMAYVDVYKLNKANGENAQVSYFGPANAWIFSSKNVTIPIHSKQEFANFCKTNNEERYKFAKLIAQAWFNILDELKLSNDQLNALKKLLNNYTLVGEYCGNPEYQHIVKYHSTSILFYAIVEKQSQDTCIPHRQASRIFQEFKLPVVKDYFKKQEGRFSNYNDLCAFLVKLFQYVAGGKIEDEEEGCVLYFELVVPEKFYAEARENGLQDRFSIPEKLDKINRKVVSLSKLKTLEYRIWRKLREKLKGTYNVDANQQRAQTLKHFSRIYAKLQFQTNDLVGQEKLQKPVEYYFFISLLAFKYVLDNHKTPHAFDTAQQHYVDFLNILFYCAENNIEPTPKIMNDKDLIMKLRGVSWSTYHTNTQEQYEKLQREMFPDYAKIKELRGDGKAKPDRKEEDWEEEEKNQEK